MEAIFAAYPFRSARFFHFIIKLGFGVGVSLAIPTSVVLWRTWDSELLCDRVLRGWLLFRFSVFAFKIPFRVFMCRALNEALSTVERAQAVERLLDLCRTYQWRTNQICGVVLYVWFALLVLASILLRGCADHSLYQLCVFQLFVFLIHMVTTFVWLSTILGRRNPHDANQPLVEFGLWTNGASRQMIAEQTVKLKLAQLQYVLSQARQTHSPDAASSSALDTPFSGDATQNTMAYRLPQRERIQCSICIVDYAEDPAKDVRLLACGHEYHSECIDAWLIKRAVCPMCQHEIDKPHQYRALLTAVQAMLRTEEAKKEQ